jgi:hypothetical protein
MHLLRIVHFPCYAQYRKNAELVSLYDCTFLEKKLLLSWWIMKAGRK